MASTTKQDKAMPVESLQYAIVQCFVVALLAAGNAGAIVINFDTAPGGAPIASGTDVTTTYASVGVTFAREGGTVCGPSVYANNDQPVGFGSAPNVVSTCAPTTASDINGTIHGRIRADFSQNATQVCVDVRPDNATLNAVLSIYDASDTQIGQVASTPGVTQTICVSGAGIRHARFPGTGGTNVEYARFDNLDVTFAAAPPPVTATGIPALHDTALIALALVLAASAAVRLRRR